MSRTLPRPYFPGSRGAAFVEAAVVITAALAVILTGMFVLLPLLRQKITEIDLEQAMQLPAVTAPEPVVYLFDEDAGQRRLLPPGQIQANLLELGNRVASNTYWKVPICTVLYEVTNSEVVCPPLSQPRTALNVAPVLSVWSGASGSSCDGVVAAKLSGDGEGDCVLKFKQFVPIDCSHAHQPVWGILVFPDFPSSYASCAVIGARYAQYMPSDVNPYY